MLENFKDYQYLIPMFGMFISLVKDRKNQFTSVIWTGVSYGGWDS